MDILQSKDIVGRRPGRVRYDDNASACPCYWLTDFRLPEHPGKPQESVDENGIITIVEYAVNDEGKKVKVSYKCRHTFCFY